MGWRVEIKNSKCWRSHLSKKVQVQKQQRKTDKLITLDEKKPLSSYNSWDGEDREVTWQTEGRKLLLADNFCWRIKLGKVCKTRH